MKTLYNDGLEHLYDAMYQTFIDYEDEFRFYNGVLSKHMVRSVLEIGSGTGNLAKHLIASGIEYTGLDQSEEMVKLATKKNIGGNFLCGDMCDFSLHQKTESIIITGRTISYLTKNADVSKALNSFKNNLTEDGIICFDFIDANRFFKEIKGGMNVNHEANFKGKNYLRKSYMKPTTEDNHLFLWKSNYFLVNATVNESIAEDNSIVRAFTKNEWEIYLDLHDFELIEFIDRKSYAFDTYVVVAKKI